jgi:hypothetical protein
LASTVRGIIVNRPYPSAAAVLTFGLALAAAADSLRAQTGAAAPNPLEPWHRGVRVHPVSDRPARHTIHSYYVSNPESPDARHVLFYASTEPTGYSGDVCILDRDTGAEVVLARDVHVEDAHRAACQQRTGGGNRVAFHDVRDGQWLVVSVDVHSRREQVLARNHQLAFGQPSSDLLPIYGPHWKPGDHRDLELVDAVTGKSRTVVTSALLEQTYGSWLAQEFSGNPVSIFFPVLAPDVRRVFFKIAAAGVDDYRSKDASHRQGLIGFDLEEKRFLFMRPKWGHPAWHPDSRRIIEVGPLLIDSNDGSYVRIPDAPALRGCHPSVSPDGKLYVMDGLLDSLGGKPGEWGIVVGDLRGHRHEIVHRFDNTRGARSWRRSDPHPVFSADLRRVYFNVSSGDWTQLFVADAGPATSAGK